MRSLRGIIPVMVYSKCLRHPNQPSHINGGDNVRMLDGPGERDSGSSKAVLFVFYGLRNGLGSTFFVIGARCLSAGRT